MKRKANTRILSEESAQLEVDSVDDRVSKHCKQAGNYIVQYLLGSDCGVLNGRLSCLLETFFVVEKRRY